VRIQLIACLVCNTSDHSFVFVLFNPNFAFRDDTNGCTASGFAFRSTTKLFAEHLAQCPNSLHVVLHPLFSLVERRIFTTHRNGCTASGFATKLFSEHFAQCPNFLQCYLLCRLPFRRIFTTYNQLARNRIPLSKENLDCMMML
jgi:hypothetical protein